MEKNQHPPLLALGEKTTALLIVKKEKILQGNFSFLRRGVKRSSVHAAPCARPPSQLQQQLWKSVLRHPPALLLTPTWRTSVLQLPFCNSWCELRGQEWVSLKPKETVDQLPLPPASICLKSHLGNVKVAPATSTHPEVHLNPSA